MRTDGDITYYVVQHKDARDEWHDTDLSHILFRAMSFEDRGGEFGDYCRRIIWKQGAGTPLWQTYGVHGYVDVKDGERALRAAKATEPEFEFRLVRRHMIREQEVVA